MTDKKATKTEKQAKKKQPTELKDDQLDATQGGGRSEADRLESELKALESGGG